MQIPSWVSPGVWGAVIGSVATMIVGFSSMGWSTAGTSEKLAMERSGTAVATALVPFCVAKAGQDADPEKLAKVKASTSSYSRSDMVRAAGWATMPGMTAPNYALSEACSERLVTAAK